MTPAMVRALQAAANTAEKHKDILERWRAWARDAPYFLDQIDELESMRAHLAKMASSGLKIFAEGG